MKYKAIYFDRDGTLTYFNPDKKKWLHNKIEEWSGHKYDLPYDKMMALFDLAGYPVDGLKSIDEEKLFWVRYYEHLLKGEGVSVSVEERATELFSELWCNNDRLLYPEVVEVMTYFKNKGYKIGIISDTSPSLQKTLEDLGLDDYIDSYVCSDLVGAMKPDPVIYQIALEELGMKAEDCLYVDDYEVESDGARALGFTAFHVDRSKTFDEKWTIRTLLEIVEFVEKNERNE